MAAHLGVSSTNIRIRDVEDSLVWSDDGKASFKAGEIINKCRIQGLKESWRRKIWASYAPAKSCWYSYIACEGRLPTLDRIQKTGVQLANRCSFCYCAEETNAHVLMNCKIAKEVWKYIAAKFDRVNYPRGDIADAFKIWIQAKITGKWRRRCWRMTFLIVCWNLWWLRNRCLHDNLQPHVSRFKKEVWRSCLDSFSSVKWPAEIELKVRIWMETGLDSVDSIVSNRNGMLINIVRASTRHGPKIAGLSYVDNGQMGCVVIINVRGSIHQGEMEVLESILRFHKDYGGACAIAVHDEGAVSTSEPFRFADEHSEAAPSFPLVTQRKRYLRKNKNIFMTTEAQRMGRRAASSRREQGGATPLQEGAVTYHCKSHAGGKTEEADA
ncbi:hypothetical protein EJ110_NYTH47389 [Nymphaea thermarum]|nr:hypothetical protein EJ110_NYTH47389 [Nymphaea thermarum]